MPDSQDLDLGYQRSLCYAFSLYIQFLVPEINTHSGWKPVFYFLMVMVRVVPRRDESFYFRISAYHISLINLAIISFVASCSNHFRKQRPHLKGTGGNSRSTLGAFVIETATLGNLTTK